MQQQDVSQPPVTEAAATNAAATAKIESTYQRQVERNALWALMITAVATMVVTYLANVDRTMIPISPDRGSVGFQYLMATMVATLVLTPYAYAQATDFRNRRLPPEMRRRYGWSIIPITLAVTLFIGLVVSGVVEILSISFEGAALNRLSAVLRTGIFAGIMSYVVVSWVMRMRDSQLIYIAIFYLFATLLIAGATHENPMWYQASFSYLGMTQSNSRFVFDLGLPFTGLLIIIWNLYFTEFFDILVEEGVVSSRTRTIVRWCVIFVGVMLAFVGIFRFGIGLMFNILHDLSATGMGVGLGVLILVMPMLIDRFPRAFYVYSFATVAMLIVAVVMKILGYYSLTGLELSAFALSSVWLLIFYRNVEQLTAQVRPDIRI